MRQSMTGFATSSGEHAALRWTWELRGVNGKGLDLRLRLPEGHEALEPDVRARAGKRLQRGNVQIALKLQGREEDAGAQLDEAALAGVLDAMVRIQRAAEGQGLEMAPSSAAQIVALRGVMTGTRQIADAEALRVTLLKDFDTALAAFVAAREREGAALAEVIVSQLDTIAELTSQAETIAGARRDEQAERMRIALARVMENTEGVDEARIAQELALIAVKADVTEEIDRLQAHVTAARELLTEEGAVGRRLDFLMQEFNREANTLCSKSGSVPLTQVGLALKTAIDQTREQVQNVE
ncbi:YicC/YloC family endoribonuclease [Salipiger mucosus]|uniref:Protein YicC n=1 Tax=Salipiger mucosus DSM 16094 TaxID=1123237 RepID=S9QAG4_9RHOB|nr:YicC/YloC family endoribonuclease [Salipiger mucosus]EPX78371.1 Protein YicC [Salipiger mucosus DSM 16094]